MEFLGAIEGRTCGNSRGHLKKTGISRVVLKKLMWSFLRPLFLTLDFVKKCYEKLYSYRKVLTV